VIREWGRSVGTAVFETVGRAVGQAQERRPLPVDLLESDEAFLAVFDAPGATASDVQVQFDDGTLEVRIDRFRGFHEGFEMVFPGRGLSLDGRVDLPDTAKVDADGAVATLKDSGELHVRIPKEGSGEIRVREEVDAGSEDEPGGTDSEGEPSADDVTESGAVVDEDGTETESEDETDGEDGTESADDPEEAA
jgi:HSP20 family molecular chaperone IbpA